MRHPQRLVQKKTCTAERSLSYRGRMSHGQTSRDLDRLDAAFAGVVAETMQALATPSRVRILGRLHAGPCSVNDLAEAVEMESSAVSHQLRVLRHLSLVVGERQGRHIVYALHDEHVGELLEQAVSHVEHLRLGIRASRDHQTEPVGASR
jgi:DNA-binding transcriptional ArsR family regulator